MGSGIVLYQFIIALCMGLAAIAFFVWAVLSGQFEDTEDVKYRILEQEEEYAAKRRDLRADRH